MNAAYLSKFVGGIVGIINGIIVPLIFAIAFLLFLIGVFRFFFAGAGEPEKRKEGRDFIIYSIIGFVVMISIWGIVNLFVYTFGFGSASRPDLPTFGSSSGNTAMCTSDSDCPVNNTCQSGQCIANK